MTALVALQKQLEGRLALSTPTRAQIMPFKVNKDTYHYRNVPVSMVNGTELGGLPRASRIKVWTTDVYWRYAINDSALVTTPAGIGGAAPGGYRFPGQPLQSIVLFQDGGIAQHLTGESAAFAQTFPIDNGKAVFIAVNDGSVITAGYDDNSGSFDCHVEILQK